MFKTAKLDWYDFEVCAPGRDLKGDGAFAYATTANSIVLAFAIGDKPAQTWHADGAILDWNNAPPEIHASFKGGKGVSNLPTDLESASRFLGGTGKQADGKALIKLFSVEGASPADHPEKWQQFLAYARQDVEAMRDVYRRTRPLPLEEWKEYWAFERINRRGVEIDLPFVRRAAALAAEDAIASGRRLAELTGGTVTTVNQAKRIATWLHDQLPDTTMREALTVGTPDEDEDGEEEAPELSLTRDRVGRVLAMLEAKRANGGLTNSEVVAHEVTTIRLYGAGASPKKFARLLAQQVDGVLRGQYRFAGAGQTGRLSSRGAQIHNLARDVLGEGGADEARLVDLIADGCTYADLAAAPPVDVPVARKLALLVRPALIAGAGKVFVWSDYNSIEARITPWLPMSPGGEKVLDIFRANDLDPSRPDIYTLAAVDVLHKAPETITRAERAIGKVVVLALGFGGSVGALLNMALGYRIHLDEAEAHRIVDAWREANPWAREFWGAHRDDESFGIWGAAMSAWESPGLIAPVGRLGFTYREDYLGGTLFMALPSGRLVTYPRPRWREVEVKDKHGNPTGERKRELSFRRAHGRAKLWHGTCCEKCGPGHGG
jgi:hypothetical protein